MSEQRIELSFSLEKDQWLDLLELVRDNSKGDSSMSKVFVQLARVMKEVGLDIFNWRGAKKAD